MLGLANLGFAAPSLLFQAKASRNAIRLLAQPIGV
jgi:hypothetical protein